MNAFFLEFSSLMIITVLISFIFYKIKQPLIIGHIFTGIIVGPFFLNILNSSSGYVAFSHIGIAFLLFIVGLHLNLKLIKEIGKTAIFTGIVQIFLTSLFGFLIAYFLDFNFIVSSLIGIGLSFSSTIVIVKLLTDNQEIEKVYGKITMGILIIQDLFAILMLIFLTTFFSTNNLSLLESIFKTFFLGIFAIGIVFLITHYLINKLLDQIANSQELLFLFVIGWCLGVSTLFSLFGFSIEIGALIAGIALASSPYEHEISSKVKPLRDFFIVIFFILLGLDLIPINSNFINFTNLTKVSFLSFSSFFVSFFSILKFKFFYLIEIFSSIFLKSIIFVLFVLIIKPLIIFLTLNFQRYHNKVSLFTSLNLSQISEFSIILFMSAKSLNLINSNQISLITLITILTILFSTYFITHLNFIYLKLSKFLKYLEIRKPKKDIEKKIEQNLNVLIFGYDRIGFSLLKTIQKLDKKYLIIDYNPQIIKKLENKNIDCIYGDASDNNFILEFNSYDIQTIISTIPEVETNMFLLKHFKNNFKKTKTIILTANNINDALELYNQGADYVILPHFLGGDFVSNLIEKYNENFSKLIEEKISHIQDLKERKNLGFDHPKHIK